MISEACAITPLGTLVNIASKAWKAFIHEIRNAVTPKGPAAVKFRMFAQKIGFCV